MKHFLIRVQNPEQTFQEMTTVRAEYGSGKYHSVLFHIYSGIQDRKLLKEITDDLKEVFEEALMVGTLSAGEIMDGELMETGILLSIMLFEQTEIQVIRYTDVEHHEAEIGRKICKELEQIPDVKALEILLPGTRYNTWLMFEELSKCAPDIQVFGGYAGGHELDDTDHFVFDEAGIYDDAVLAITYAGKSFHIQTDKSVGWQTLGQSFQVTKADGNRLIKIDGSPAVEVYEEYLGIDRHGNFAEETFEFPLMLQTEGDELLRHTTAVEEDGSLLLAGYVTEGMEVLLCFGNPSMIVERVNSRLEDIRQFDPEAILLYSCSVRKAFWEKYVDMEMLPFARLAKTAGFHTWGEVKRNPDTKNILEYNITLLSIAMREGDAREPKLPEVHVDDSVLKGQASLIKRLAQLVATTTQELQTAYENMLQLNDRLVDITEHDALTEIFNRRKIEHIMTRELNRCINTDIPVSLIMLDIDHFKAVNDTYGHAIGDDVLKQVAKLMQEAAAGVKYAAVGRWGGEEFFIMLPKTGREEARSFAESLRIRIANFDFPEVHHLTISMGVITAIGCGKQYGLFTKVDDALYEAKASGRNRVVQV